MREHHAWRLSLSSLFVWMAALGAGFAAASASRGLWSDVISRGLVATATVLVAIGLMVEAVDLRSAYRAASFPSRDARFGHWLAVAWRAVLAVVLVALLMVEYLVNRGLIDLEPQIYSYPNYQTSTFLWTGHYFALLIAIWPRRAGAQYSPRRGAKLILRCAVAILVWLMLIAYFARKMLDTLLVTFLVDVAINGVQMAQPLAYVDRAIGDERVSLLSSFLWSSLVACICVGIALLTTYGATRPKRVLAWRGAACAAIMVSLTTAVVCLAWNVHRLGPRLSPEFYQVGFQPWPAMWASAAVLPALLITAVAIRLAARPIDFEGLQAGSDARSQSASHDASVLHCDSWWHRRRPTLALLLVGAAISLDAVGRGILGGQRSVSEALLNTPFVAFTNWGQWFRDLLLAVLETLTALTYFDLGAPPPYWTALVIWACVVGLFRRSSSKGAPAIVPVSAPALAFAWLVLAAIVAVAVPTIFFTTWSLLWSPLFWGRWW